VARGRGAVPRWTERGDPLACSLVAERALSERSEDIPLSDRESEADRREASIANGVRANEVSAGSKDERSESFGEGSEP